MSSWSLSFLDALFLERLGQRGPEDRGGVVAHLVELPGVHVHVAPRREVDAHDAAALGPAFRVAERLQVLFERYAAARYVGGAERGVSSFIACCTVARVEASAGASMAERLKLFAC